MLGRVCPQVQSEMKGTQSCLTVCDPMDCILPGSSVHRILQARILEWVAISFSRGSSWPRDRTLVFCIVGTFFTVWDTGEVPLLLYLTEILDGSEKSFRVRKIWVTFPVFCLFLIAGITLNKLLYFPSLLILAAFTKVCFTIDGFVLPKTVPRSVWVQVEVLQTLSNDLLTKCSWSCLSALPAT